MSFVCLVGTRKIQHRKGHRCLYQERIRQEIQPDVALHCWKKLRQLRYSRNETFYLFLPRTSCSSLIQIWLNNSSDYTSLSLNCSVEVWKHFHGVGIFILSTVPNYHKVICVCVLKHRFVNIYRWARLKQTLLFLMLLPFFT